MVFKKNKLRDFIAILLGSIPILIIFSLYNNFNSKIATIIFDFICVTIIAVFYILKNNEKYLLGEDEIIFSGFFTNNFRIQISDIDFIRQVFTARGNSSEYEIVLCDKAQDSIKVNNNILNENGECLITILKNRYSIKLYEAI